MFCSKSANKEIRRTNKRALTVLCEDYDSSFEQPFEKDGSITVHHKDLQNLMTECYKTTNQMNPPYFCRKGYALQSPYQGTMQASTSANEYVDMD